jgi:hypothetical protein
VAVAFSAVADWPAGACDGVDGMQRRSDLTDALPEWQQPRTDRAAGALEHGLQCYIVLDVCMVRPCRGSAEPCPVCALASYLVHTH